MLQMHTGPQEQSCSHAVSAGCGLSLLFVPDGSRIHFFALELVSAGLASVAKTLNVLGCLSMPARI